MKYAISILALLALTACQPRLVNDVAGITDESLANSRAAAAAREAELSGQAAAQAQAEAQARAQAEAQATADAQRAAAATQQAQTSGVAASPTNTAPEIVTAQATNSAAISDEQNFDAVAGRESIESDAARIAANRQKYVLIEPTALPNRTATGPNIVEYAIKTNNPVGVALYRRLNILGSNRHIRNCQQYLSADLAQQDFLRRGGPQRDRMGLDPDGDGFACRWNPEPFRQAVQN